MAEIYNSRRLTNYRHEHITDSSDFYVMAHAEYGKPNNRYEIKPEQHSHIEKWGNSTNGYNFGEYGF